MIHVLTHHHYVLLRCHFRCRSSGSNIPQIMVGAYLNRSPGAPPEDYAKITDNFCTIELEADGSMERYDIPLTARIDGKMDGTHRAVVFVDLYTTGTIIQRENLDFIPVCVYIYYLWVKFIISHVFIIN